jgi:hypothetical protein
MKRQPKKKSHAIKKNSIPSDENRALPFTCNNNYTIDHVWQRQERYVNARENEFSRDYSISDMLHFINYSRTFSGKTSFAIQIASNIKYQLFVLHCRPNLWFVPVPKL